MAQARFGYVRRERAPFDRPACGTRAADTSARPPASVESVGAAELLGPRRAAGRTSEKPVLRALVWSSIGSRKSVARLVKRLRHMNAFQRQKALIASLELLIVLEDHLHELVTIDQS